MINKVRPVVGGVVLAFAVLTLLALAGVGSDRRPARTTAGPAPVSVRDPSTTTQPELHRMLLSTKDLSGGPKAAVPSPAGARTECRTLFESLAPLSAPSSGRAETVLTRAGATLRQAVTVYPARDAADAVAKLRHASAACPRFTATEEGLPVTVEMTEVAALDPGRDAFTVGLSVLGRHGALTGYLAVGRSGQAVSVLRELGPAGIVRRGDVAGVLRLALDKLSPLVRTGG